MGIVVASTHSHGSSGVLLDGGKLALTHLGRHRAGDAFVKHHIKAVDRLLGNTHLHRERLAIYRSMARGALPKTSQPLLLVDWADCELDRERLVLRASVPMYGRAFTVYEEVHPMSRYNNRLTHRAFLQRLRDIVPSSVNPIVVTDAGFRGPWFRDVEALGWDWIGRFRNNINVFDPATKCWTLGKVLHETATATPKHIGWRRLAKRGGYWCRRWPRLCCGYTVLARAQKI